MFAKSLIMFAAAAQAIKIKSGLAANALVGVNIKALSTAELESLLVATADQFGEFCHEHGKHYISEAETKARQTNWLQTEAANQSHNANENSSATFGHNQFSDMTEEEKSKSQGAKAPQDAEDNHNALAKCEHGFHVEMTQEEYQELYDHKYAELAEDCDAFDSYFQQKDDAFMERKESQLKKRLMHNRDWTEEQFDTYWSEVVANRAAVQEAITRCGDEGYEAHEHEDDEETTTLAQNKYGFSIKMSTEEYQALYDEKWAESDRTCQRFDTIFNNKDDRYMTRQEEKKRERKLAKGWTEDEFDAWWMRIMQDRTVAQASITRCFNDNDGQDNVDPTPDPEPEPQPNPTPDECSANQSEFIWGDNVVVPIKNQGQCGSCYSFSAMTVLEGAMAIQNNQQAQSLSEQQIVDCQNEYEHCQGCNGGWPVSLHESTRSYPVVLTADYPYVAREETCKHPSSSQNVSAADVYYIQGTPDAVKSALCVGPITLTVKANGPFMSYSGGVMTSADCPYNNDLDHAVSAIGWKVMDGQEVLIVRNSWGPWWGAEGYIYMAMDSGNNGMGPCGIFAYPSSATVAQ